MLTAWAQLCASWEWSAGRAVGHAQCPERGPCRQSSFPCTRSGTQNLTRHSHVNSITVVNWKHLRLGPSEITELCKALHAWQHLCQWACTAKHLSPHQAQKRLVAGGAPADRERLHACIAHTRVSIVQQDGTEQHCQTEIAWGITCEVQIWSGHSLLEGPHPTQLHKLVNM